MNKTRTGIIAMVMVLLMSLSVSAVTFVGDNAVITGGNQTDAILIQDSTNVTFQDVNFQNTVTVNNSDSIVFNRSRFTGSDITVTASATNIVAQESYFNSAYAPLHATNVTAGCPDGDGVTITGDILTTPWFRASDFTDPSGNCNPVLDAIANQEGNLNNLFVYQTVCTDPNTGDVLAWTDNTSVFNIGPGNGTISFTPSVPANESVLITCSDSEFQDTQSFRFAVMAGSGYMANYVTGNVADVTIDLVTGPLAFIAGLTAIIAIYLLFMWLGGRRPPFLNRWMR